MADVDMTDAPTAPVRRAAGKAKPNDGGANDKKRFEVKKVSQRYFESVFPHMDADDCAVERGRLVGMGYRC